LQLTTHLHLNPEVKKEWKYSLYAYTAWTRKTLPFTFPYAEVGTKLQPSYAIPQQNSKTPEVPALISFSALNSQTSGSHDNIQQTADSPMCVGHQYTRFLGCQFCSFSYHFVALLFKIMAMLSMNWISAMQYVR
jgi:hypothetical protein